MNLQEARKKFTQYLDELGRSPATITAYEKDLEQLQDSIGNQEVAKITTKNLEKFLTDAGKQGYSNKTLSRKLNSIKSFFKFLNKQGKILVDPSKPIPHPDIKTKLPRVLSSTEYRSIRDAAKNNIRLYTIIEMLLQTGMRIGEISRLKLEDVKLSQDPAQLLIREYGSSPMRLVELNETASKVIKEFIPHRLEVEGDEGYLFNTKNGGNMLVRNIRSAINRVFKKAGVKNATVNDLRNTFIVNQLDKGVSLEKVAQTVGHKRFTSTEKYLPLVDRKKPGKKNRIEVL
jgi:site-specific recombinase XerD